LVEQYGFPHPPEADQQSAFCRVSYPQPLDGHTHPLSQLVASR
jgi:hypothetical protein